MPPHNYLEPLEKGFASLVPLGPYWTEIGAEINKELAAIVTNGKSAKDGPEAAARVCDEILRRRAAS